MSSAQSIRSSSVPASSVVATKKTLPLNEVNSVGDDDLVALEYVVLMSLTRYGACAPRGRASSAKRTRLACCGTPYENFMSRWRVMDHTPKCVIPPSSYLRNPAPGDSDYETGVATAVDTQTDVSKGLHPHRERQVVDISSPLYRKHEGRPFGGLRQLLVQLLHAGDFRAVHADDVVAGVKADRLAARATGHFIDDDRAAAAAHAQAGHLRQNAQAEVVGRIGGVQ